MGALYQKTTKNSRATVQSNYDTMLTDAICPNAANQKRRDGLCCSEIWARATAFQLRCLPKQSIPRSKSCVMLDSSCSVIRTWSIAHYFQPSFKEIDLLKARARTLQYSSSSRSAH
ncbi:hypothetical protein CLAIMM_09301 [Cladophialophora immunda]|nr:hypothetical protein CLAIMM_09301 [Cladophialophora immunda]